jgi:hypothetical protein
MVAPDDHPQVADKRDGIVGVDSLLVKIHAVAPLSDALPSHGPPQRLVPLARRPGDLPAVRKPVGIAQFAST